MKDAKTISLVRLAKRQDPDAFTELIEQQMQGMYRVARSILHNDEDAADAIQETILTCWEKLSTLKKDQYFKTWLTRILINNCYRLIDQSRHITYTDELPDIPVNTEEPLLDWEELLSTLDKNYRLVIILFYSHGFRTKEIARILGLPDSTVRTRLARARKQLQKIYKERSEL